MRDLYWLPIRARINFKVLLLTFKALHGLEPQYLQSLISVKTSCYNLRGSNTLLLAVTSVKYKATLGDQAFSVAAIFLFTLNRDFTNTFANYLSISIYHIVYIF